MNHTPNMPAARFCLFDGNLRQRDYAPLHVRAAAYSLPNDSETLECDLENFRLSGIDFIQLQLDEGKLADRNGDVPERPELEIFDRFLELSEQGGIRLGLRMIASRKFRGEYAEWRQLENLYREMRPFQAYFSGLFTHRNKFSGRPVHDYGNIAAIEPINDVGYFSRDEFWWFNYLLCPYIDHYFVDRAVKFYAGSRAAVPGPVAACMTESGYHFFSLPPSPRRLRFEAESGGLRQAVFQAEIRETGTDLWHPLAVVEATSNSLPPHRNGGGEGFLSFDADGPAELRLRFPTPVKSAGFRPSLKEKLEPVCRGNCVTLRIDHPRYGVLEVNYDAPELPAFTAYLFRDDIEPDPAEAEHYGKPIRFLAPGTHSPEELQSGPEELLYFQPGTHNFPEPRLNVRSGQEIYLARGAVLKCGIAGYEVENVRIFGRGVIDASNNVREWGENWQSLGEEGCLFFLRGRNITIDGPILYNPQFWSLVIAGTDHFTLRNYKLVAWVINDDGIQPRSCSNLLAENCFLKCMDDAVAIKTRRAAGMESRRLVFRNLVIWKEFAHGLEIGHTSQADILEDVLFENVEIVGTGNNALSMHIIDHELVSHVVYDHIYLEGKPFQCAIGLYIWGDPSPYKTDRDCGRIKNVTFRNLFFEYPPPCVELAGYDADHPIENIRIQDCRVLDGNGDFVRIDPGRQLEIRKKHVRNIELK